MLPSLRYMCLGRADTQGASHGIILSFRGLAHIKMEPLRNCLLWPCFAKWQHLGHRLFAQGMTEVILKSPCRPGGSFLWLFIGPPKNAPLSPKRVQLPPPCEDLGFQLNAIFPFCSKMAERHELVGWGLIPTGRRGDWERERLGDSLVEKKEELEI